MHVNVDEFVQFCKQFYDAIVRIQVSNQIDELKKPNMILNECSKTCNFTLDEPESSEYALKLLVGVLDKNYETEFSNKRLKNLKLLVYGNIWTASLEQLLTLDEVEEGWQAVYDNAKFAMRRIIVKTTIRAILLWKLLTDGL